MLNNNDKLPTLIIVVVFVSLRMTGIYSPDANILGLTLIYTLAWLGLEQAFKLYSKSKEDNNEKD